MVTCHHTQHDPITADLLQNFWVILSSSLRGPLLSEAVKCTTVTANGSVIWCSQHLMQHPGPWITSTLSSHTMYSKTAHSWPILAKPHIRTKSLQSISVRSAISAFSHIMLVDAQQDRDWQAGLMEEPSGRQAGWLDGCWLAANNMWVRGGVGWLYNLLQGVLAGVHMLICR